MIFRNKLEELSYKLSPFKYIENTMGCIVVKSDNEVNEIIDTLSECTKEINDNEIKLINGSVVTIIKSKSEVIRGKRANIPIYFDDFEEVSISILDGFTINKN